MSVEISGERVLLRDGRVEDVDARIRWVTVEMEWGDWDGPWEGNEPVPPEKVEGVRQRMVEAVSQPLQEPRNMLYIQHMDGPLLGWVSCYGHDATERSVCVGIDICESGFWRRGLGTEALRLWLGYLFENMDLACIRTSTWSGNARMIRCAEKCGFRLVETVSGVREVRGERYDQVKFLRSREDWDSNAD